jgi:hypothetical protein
MSGIDHLPMVNTLATPFTPTASPIFQGIAKLFIDFIQNIYDRFVKAKAPSTPVATQPRTYVIAAPSKPTECYEGSQKLLKQTRYENTKQPFKFVPGNDTSDPLLRDPPVTSSKYSDYNLEEMDLIAFELACQQPSIISETYSHYAEKIKYFQKYCDRYDGYYKENALKTIDEAGNNLTKNSQSKPKWVTLAQPQAVQQKPKLRPQPTPRHQLKPNITYTTPQKRPVKVVKISSKQLTNDQLFEKLNKEKVDILSQTEESLKKELQDIVYYPEQYTISYDTWKCCVDLYSREVNDIKNIWTKWNRLPKADFDKLHNYKKKLYKEFRNTFKVETENNVTERRSLRDTVADARWRYL